MAYPLDVLFVDANWRVLRVARLRPFGLRSCRGAAAVLELRAGEADRLGMKPGTMIEPIDQAAAEISQPC